MRKVALFACLLALAICATAEDRSINPGSLPASTTPSPVPASFGGLDWLGVDYVSPAWSSAGPGMRLGPDADDVIFGGGPICRSEPIACYSSITSTTEFRAISAEVAAASGDNFIVVTAYLHGQFLGSQRYNLSSDRVSTIMFPVTWGNVTQLVIHPSDGSEFVLYRLTMEANGDA
jgi:hypothetical protein